MSDPNAPSFQPLYSEFRDDADMAELVELFVSEMPERISTLTDAYTEGNIERIRVESHRLKGAAAGYGYPILTAVASKLEDAITASGEPDLEAIKQEFSELVSLCQRVQ